MSQPPFTQDPPGRQEGGAPRTPANPAATGRQTPDAERLTHTAYPAPTNPGVYTPRPPNTNQVPTRITGISNLSKSRKKKEKKKNRKGKGDKI
jgi:hypothetical protein